MRIVVCLVHDEPDKPTQYQSIDLGGPIPGYLEGQDEARRGIIISSMALAAHERLIDWYREREWFGE